MTLCSTLLQRVGDFVSAIIGVVVQTVGVAPSGSEYELFPRSLLTAIKPTGSVQQCSTTHNFVLSEEHFIPSPVSEKSPNEKSGVQQAVCGETGAFISLSPVSSIKSNSSVNGQVSSLSTVSTGSREEEEDEEDGDGEKAHECEFCDAKFRIRGYLTRHMKKHSSKKAYHCPFHDASKAQGKCHATGGFSRRDTFKTHLKARHFKYPPGVKSSNRTGMPGWCGICGDKFINNEIWVERHIEGGKCRGLPQSYLDSLNPGKKKTGKHSKFLDVEDVNESLQLSSDTKEALGKLVSPTATNTPSPTSALEYPGQMSQMGNLHATRPQSHYNPSPLPSLNSGLLSYNTNYMGYQGDAPAHSENSNPQQHSQEQSPASFMGLGLGKYMGQPEHSSPLAVQSAVDATDINVLLKRKQMLEQYITTLQRAAAAQQLDYNSNNFKAEGTNFPSDTHHTHAQSEDYPSLDSECSPSLSLGYPLTAGYPLD